MYIILLGCANKYNSVWRSLTLWTWFLSVSHTQRPRFGLLSLSLMPLWCVHILTIDCEKTYYIFNQPFTSITTTHLWLAENSLIHRFCFDNWTFLHIVYLYLIEYAIPCSLNVNNILLLHFVSCNLAPHSVWPIVYSRGRQPLRGTVTSGTLGISVQNIKIVFSDPERDHRQSASPRYLQKEAMHATQPRSL